jgi:3-hydroxyisobutyrate dehydrogenase-like beta-hydroxyacid dehydrogenase
MKIINNMIGIAVAPIAAEAYALAQAQGLELAQVSRVLDASTGRNFLSEDSAGPAAAFASMTPDSAGFASLLEVMRKDLALAVDLAGRQPACWPALAAVQSLVDALDDDTLARWRRLAEAR